MVRPPSSGIGSLNLRCQPFSAVRRTGPRLPGRSGDRPYARVFLAAACGLRHQVVLTAQADRRFPACPGVGVVTPPVRLRRCSSCCGGMAALRDQPDPRFFEDEALTVPKRRARHEVDRHQGYDTGGSEAERTLVRRLRLRSVRQWTTLPRPQHRSTMSPKCAGCGSETRRSPDGELARESDDHTSSGAVKPGSIVSDNGTDVHLQCHAGLVQGHQHQLALHRPGKPIQNAFVESFIGRNAGSRILPTFWAARRPCSLRLNFAPRSPGRSSAVLWNSVLLLDERAAAPHSSLETLLSPAWDCLPTSWPSVHRNGTADRRMRNPDASFQSDRLVASTVIDFRHSGCTLKAGRKGSAAPSAPALNPSHEGCTPNKPS